MRKRTVFGIVPVVAHATTGTAGHRRAPPILPRCDNLILESEKFIVLTVELHTGDIPNVFARFSEVIGDRYWLQRLASIKKTIRDQPFLKNHLVKENSIAIALSRCSDLVTRYGCIPMTEVEDVSLYPAIGLAAQVLSIMEHTSDVEAGKLVKRIQGAFQRPDSMRAIQFEIRAATHFIRRGHAVAWPEMEGIGTFDLLVKDLGTNGLEIECKSVSSDRGRKIHRHEALEFYQLIEKPLQTVGQHLQTGMAIVLTIPGRLPTSLRQREVLAKNVINSFVSTGSTVLEDGSDIRVSEFDMANLGVNRTASGIVIPKDAIDRVTATRNRESLFSGNDNGAVIFVLQSRQDDTMLQYVFEKVNEAAKKQLSRSKPAIILVGFNGLEAEGLLDIVMQDNDPKQSPTALRVAVSEFHENPNRDHVVGVGFLSEGALAQNQPGAIESSGVTYFFPKKKGRFWHEDFSGLFS